MGPKITTKSAGSGQRTRGYTLWELLIVILIIGLLAAAAIPLMRGRVDDAKWSEANAAAGMIQGAIKTYYAKSGIPLIGRMNNALILRVLDIEETDLTGSFFVPGDYEVVTVDAFGRSEVRVTGSLAKAPAGSRTLYPNGNWE